MQKRGRVHNQKQTPKGSGGQRVPTSRPEWRELKKAWSADEDLRRMIREEARKLKLSEEEYLRLMTHFSEVLRTSVLPASALNGGLLTTILQNPLVLDMLKGMIRNMLEGVVNKSKPVTSDAGAALPGRPYGLPSHEPRGNGSMGGLTYPLPVPPGPRIPQAPDHLNGYGPYQAPHGHGDSGMWGMPTPYEQRPHRAPETKPEAKAESSGSGGDEWMDQLMRMVAQFLQK
jgi:hypothetical protein